VGSVTIVKQRQKFASVTENFENFMLFLYAGIVTVEGSFTIVVNFYAIGPGG